MGMGQGAGNLQTELLLGYLITEFDANYHYEEVLDVCEMIESYSCVPLWGYSVTRMLPALYRVAYKYSTYLRYVLGLSYREINEILSKMPDDLRHRYTPENIKKHLLSIGKRELANRDTQ